MSDGAMISGTDASVKEFLAKQLNSQTKGFGKDVVRSLRLVEVSINQNAAEPTRAESRVVLNMKVEEGFLNSKDAVHGGCIAYLIDLCSTLALVAYALSKPGIPLTTVSQSLNIVYHSPALLGDELRIANSTMTVGSRVLSARTEIWNLTKKRLVASGVHIKMPPSQKL